MIQVIDGWLLENGAWRKLAYQGRDNFDVTAMAGLGDGSLVCPWSDGTWSLCLWSIRLRHIAPEMLEGDSIIDPPILATFSNALLIDNFEGIAVRPAPDDSGYLIYIISDDNFYTIQRTLLYQFHLAGIMTTLTLNIRSATPDDLKACFGLYCEVQEIHVAARPDLFKPPEFDDNFRRLVGDAIEAEHKGIVLAWHQAAAVGMAIYEFTRLDPTGVYLIDRPILWLESVVVSADYRGKGCGKAMMDLLKRLAAENGVETLALEAWRFNEAAQAWFERQGFATHSNTMMAVIGDD